jgi:hypothetical protein
MLKFLMSAPSLEVGKAAIDEPEFVEGRVVDEGTIIICVVNTTVLLNPVFNTNVVASAGTCVVVISVNVSSTIVVVVSGDTGPPLVSSRVEVCSPVSLSPALYSDRERVVSICPGILGGLTVLVSLLSIVNCSFSQYNKART